MYTTPYLMDEWMDGWMDEWMDIIMKKRLVDKQTSSSLETAKYFISTCR